MKKSEYKKIIDDAIRSTIIMTMTTSANEDLDKSTKLIQMVTAIAIMASFFDYIESESNEDTKAVGRQYKELFKLYQKDGILKSVADKEEDTKNQNEDDNSKSK